MPELISDLENLALTVQDNLEPGSHLLDERPDQLDLGKMTIEEMIHARQWIDGYSPEDLIAPLSAQQAREEAIQPDEVTQSSKVTPTEDTPSFWDSTTEALRNLADRTEDTPLGIATRRVRPWVSGLVKLIPTTDAVGDTKENTGEASNRGNRIPPVVLYYRVLVDKISKEFSPQLAQDFRKQYGLETAFSPDEDCLGSSVVRLRDATFIYNPAGQKLGKETTGRTKKIDMKQLTEVTGEDMQAAGFLLDMLREELNNRTIDANQYAHLIIDLVEKNEFSDNQRHYLLEQSHVTAKQIAGSYYRGPAMDLHMTEHMTELVGRWLFEDMVERIDAKAHIEIEEAQALADIRPILDHVPELGEREKADFFIKLAKRFDERLVELDDLLADYDAPRTERYIDTSGKIPRPTKRELRKNTRTLTLDEVERLQKERRQITNLQHRSDHFYLEPIEDSDTI
jgi:hypothetical protein